MTQSIQQADRSASEKFRIAELLLKKRGIRIPESTALPRRASIGPARLSFAQQRMWFLDQLNPGTAVYNVILDVSIKGELNIKALENSLAEVVRRHDVLRTTFVVVDEEPVQVVSAFAGWSMPLVDLTRIEDPLREEELFRRAGEIAEMPFDLVAGPVIRNCLFRLGEADYVLLVSMHHIATDEWAMKVFVDEVMSLYRAFVAGEGSPLQAIPIQYADYAEWQRKRLQGERLDAEVGYWKRRLEGLASTPVMPTDKRRPAAKAYQGGAEFGRISAKLTAEINALSRREAVTPFITLLACFKTLIARYTGQQDVVVGTPVANRSRVETESLIGLFINTLVLRTQLPSDPTLRSILRAVKSTVTEAQSHQDLPFEVLVEELDPPRDAAYTPFFQMMFVMQEPERAGGEEAGVAGLEISRLGLGSSAAKFDLSVFAKERDGRLTLAVEYDGALYEAATARRMLGHLECLIEGLAGDPDQPLSTVPLLTSEEQHQIVEEWNDTRVAHRHSNKMVTESFESQAAKRPDFLAVVCGDEALSYGELSNTSSKFARRLREIGVGPDTVVGILTSRNIGMIVAALSVLKAGGAYLPLDHAWPAERLGFILDDANAAVLLTERGLADSVGFSGETLYISDVLAALERESNVRIPNSAAPSNLAYVIYTSGSTGKPKGVEIQHSSLTNLACWHQRAFKATPRDRATQIAGLGFDASVWEVWPYLAAGASLFIPPDDVCAEPRRLMEWMTERAITIAFVPTPLAELMLQEEQPAASALRVMLTGGDRLHRPRAAFPFSLVNNYGPTENTVVATSCEVDMSEQDRDPVIGSPIDNVRLYPLDSNMRLAPIGVPGQLAIGGRGLARCYRNRPDLTAEKFIPDPISSEAGATLYMTGDLARYLPDGKIEFIGRADHQVKVRGFRIELGEVEAVLGAHPAVREALIVVHQDSSGANSLVGYVAPQPGSDVTPTELRDFMRIRLPEYMTPSGFVLLEALPLTANGKVDRDALPYPEEFLSGLAEDYIAPRTLVEMQLVELWQETLDVERIGIRDNFFRLGGHSLLAVRLMNGIERITGKRLALSVLFEEPTVEHLAARLSNYEAADSSSAVVAIQRHGSRLPFFCVHPAGGSVFCYVDLARELGREQPFYGLQSRGLDGSVSSRTTIEEMAADYVQAIRAIQPRGPYLLGGWSIGGLVSLEMALQLERLGDEAALIALMDTVAPTRYHTFTSGSDPSLLANFVRDLGLSWEQLPLSWDQFTQLDDSARWNYVMEGIRASGVVPPDFDSTRIHALFDVFRTNAAAAQKYIPRAKTARVLLLAAEAAESPEVRARQWRDWVFDSVDLYPAPGTHFTMLREPNVGVAAERLSLCLEHAVSAIQMVG